jgi:hypothetical protein
MTINIVSFGSECDIKYQINKYLNLTKETEFFDWLISDIDSVCDILSKDINTILTFPNIQLIGYKNINSIVKFKNCTKLVSMHDVPIKYSFNDINNFILKYKRRYNRLIELIKSNNKTYIIRRDNPLDNKITKFINIINIINPINNITLILLRNDIIDHYIFSKRVICINFNKFKLNKNNDWQKNNYAWNLLFDFIIEISKDN